MKTLTQQNKFLYYAALIMFCICNVSTRQKNTQPWHNHAIYEIIKEAILDSHNLY